MYFSTHVSLFLSVFFFKQILSFDRSILRNKAHKKLKGFFSFGGVLLRPPGWAISTRRRLLLVG